MNMLQNEMLTILKESRVFTRVSICLSLYSKTPFAKNMVSCVFIKQINYNGKI